MRQVCDPAFVDDDPNSLANRMRAVFGLPIGKPTTTKETKGPQQQYSNNMESFETESGVTLRRAADLLAGPNVGDDAGAIEAERRKGGQDTPGTPVRVHTIAHGGEALPGTPSTVDGTTQKERLLDMTGGFPVGPAAAGGTESGQGAATVALAAFADGARFDALARQVNPPHAEVTQQQHGDEEEGRQQQQQQQQQHFDAKEHRAATKIQAAFKGRKVRQTMTEEHNAATKIQAAFKGRKVRQSIAEEHLAAAKIQAAFKERKQRKVKANAADGLPSVRADSAAAASHSQEPSKRAVTTRGRTIAREPCNSLFATAAPTPTPPTHPPQTAATTARSKNAMATPPLPSDAREAAGHKGETARSRLTYDAWLLEKKTQKQKKRKKAARLRAANEKLQIASNESKAQKDAEAAEKYQDWLVATENTSHAAQLERAKVIREQEATKRESREESFKKAQEAYAEWEETKQTESVERREGQRAAKQAAAQSKVRRKTDAEEAYAKWLAEDHAVQATWVNQKTWVHTEPEEAAFRHPTAQQQRVHPWDREDAGTKKKTYSRNRSPVRRWLP